MLSIHPWFIHLLCNLHAILIFAHVFQYDILNSEHRLFFKDCLGRGLFWACVTKCLLSPPLCSFLLDFTLSNATLVHVLNELLSFHPVNKRTDVPTVPKEGLACQVQHASYRGKEVCDYTLIPNFLLFWSNSSSAQSLLPSVRIHWAHTVFWSQRYWSLGGLTVINGSWQAHNGVFVG